MQKKNKLNFYSTIEGVEHIMPIISAKDYLHEWVKKARSSLLEQKNSHAHTLRCPGIMSSLAQGWIIKTWQDMEITILKNGAYSFRSAVDVREFKSNLNDTSIVIHDESNMYDFRTNWPKDTFSKIIKINTPWLVQIPKGYMLYQTHPCYLDENRFTSLPAIYDPDYGLLRLMVPMFWHSLEGKFLISAGTPIAQIFLIKKEDFNIEMSYISDNNKALKHLNLTLLSLRNRFKRNYLKIKEIFKKYEF